MAPEPEPVKGACDPPPAADPVLVCDLCIGRPRGCRVDFQGVHWCGKRRGHMPGYLAVGSDGGLTGYREHRPGDDPSPATAARIEAFLAEHAARAAADRERAARCAAVVRAGLGAIPAKELPELLDDAVGATRTVADLRADIADLADAVVRGAA